MAVPDRPSTATRPPAGGLGPSGPTDTMQAPSGPADHEKPDREKPDREKQSLPELGKELIDLTVTYAKQETIDPLRTIGRRVGLGILGSAIASVGLVFLVVGVLRLVQVEVGFGGAMSWVPYLAALVVAGVVAALALKQIGGGRGR